MDEDGTIKEVPFGSKTIWLCDTHYHDPTIKAFWAEGDFLNVEY
jgi:hypothetical protein